MAEIRLERGKTALLLADFTKDAHTMERAGEYECAREILYAVRDARLFVVYIVTNFRPGYPEVSDRHKDYGVRKASGTLSPPAEDPLTLIHPSVLPRQGEVIVVKHRNSAFFGTDLDIVLRAQGIDTLILMGFSTAGVINSTVCYAADADYQLIVVGDACAAADPEVNRLLMEKVFPRRATVASSKEVVGALAAL